MGCLELDHLGAEVGEAERAERARDQLRELDDANAVEDTWSELRFV
jgi:hypothetical protein